MPQACPGTANLAHLKTTVIIGSQGRSLHQQLKKITAFSRLHIYSNHCLLNHHINHSPYQQGFYLSKDARPILCRLKVVYLNINGSYSSDCNGVGTCIFGNGNIQSSSSDKDASIFESKEGSVTKAE